VSESYDENGPSIELDGPTVFHGLGFADADQLAIKAELLVEIGQLVKSKGLNKTQAAEAMGLTRPEASYLLNGRLERFTIDRLVRVLGQLDPGRRVRITFEPKKGLHV
jgi:predicted XRE-type DNA-binding protein